MKRLNERTATDNLLLAKSNKEGGDYMNWKLFSVTLLGASMILSSQVLAAGPGGQGGAQNRMMTSGSGPKPQMPSLQRESIQQRERSQGPQATLPEQASETARAAVDNAGMGKATAESVKETIEFEVQPAPESETSVLLSEPTADQ
jgi:hypothetical protein